MVLILPLLLLPPLFLKDWLRQFGPLPWRSSEHDGPERASLGLSFSQILLGKPACHARLTFQTLIVQWLSGSP